MSVTVSPAAQADVTASALWYDQQPDQYGAAFNEAVRDAVRKIGEAPRLYSPAEDGIPGREFRECFIARFQQRVIYLVTGEDVLVVAVVHALRREGAWHRNLPPAN